jgi:plasmid maintenance system antidote protein VapI
MASMTAPRDIQGQLRQAIRDSGISGYRLALDTGVPQAVLSHFLNCKRSITMDTAAKLATALGLELRPMDLAGKSGKARVKRGKSIKRQ